MKIKYIISILVSVLALSLLACPITQKNSRRTWMLTYLGRYSNANIDYASSVTVSPDGKHVYVSAYNADAVAWFTRDSGTGALTYGDRYSNTNIDYASSVTVSPDGKHVYVAAYNADAVAWFRPD